MLFKLTNTTKFPLLYNIDDQHKYNSDQMFSAQWET